MEALLVFSHSIRYLKDRAIEIIRERTGDEGYSAKDTQWVITVPAIWKPPAKQFMREAAYQVNYCCLIANESSSGTKQFMCLYIPNRKRFPCFHRVKVTRVKFGRTRNAVCGSCFHSNFEFSQTFTRVTGNTGKMCSIVFMKYNHEAIF